MLRAFSWDALRAPMNLELLNGSWVVATDRVRRAAGDLVDHDRVGDQLKLGASPVDT
jgi:hypothetical protein